MQLQWFAKSAFLNRWSLSGTARRTEVLAREGSRSFGHWGRREIERSRDEGHDAANRFGSAATNRDSHVYRKPGEMDDPASAGSSSQAKELRTFESLWWTTDCSPSTIYDSRKNQEAMPTATELSRLPAHRRMRGLPSIPGEKTPRHQRLIWRFYGSAAHWKNSVISGAVAAAPGKVVTPSPLSMSRKVL